MATARATVTRLAIPNSFDISAFNEMFPGLGEPPADENLPGDS